MPENYIVSARKYRPPTFNMVVGQDHVTTTLKNAITGNKTAQSYLFTGPRGIGKTTCARIFAKALNCENRKEDGEPCNECNSCLTFNEQRSMNIYELDAASNNSVDDIRMLNEQVRFGPQTGKYKVYIIDEVHMLSANAFNAFLKTLEEPPSYAVFILATTEKQKIIPTILSRCQIFDFKRIKVKDIKDYLVVIAGKEKVEFEETALHIIAQKADGALRDALSIFDRIVSFTGNNISYASVIENLNIIDYEYYFKFVNYFLEKDVANSLLLFNDLVQLGFDGQNLILGLSAHLRDLYVTQMANTKTLIEVAEDILPAYVEQAEKVDESFILTSLNILSQFNLRYKESKNQRLHTELCLIKICHLTDALDLGKLLSDQKKNISPERQIKKTAAPARPNVVEKKSQTPPPQPQSKPQPFPEVETTKEEVKPSAVTEKKEEYTVKPTQRKSFLGVNPEQLKKQIEEEERVTESKESGSQPGETDGSPDTEPVNREDFFKAWDDIVEKNLKSEMSLYNSLKSYPPVFVDDNSLQIEFKNSVLENMFVKEKQNISSILNSEHHIHNLTIKTIVKKPTKEEKEKYLVDPRQIFEYLAEKNPDLEYAQQKLGLKVTD